MVKPQSRSRYARRYATHNKLRNGIHNRFLSSDSGAIDWIASLLHAVPAPHRPEKPTVNRQKFSLTKIVKRPIYPTMNHLHVVLLDTSASTLSGAALQQSKAIVAAINHMAYVKRERLALVIFGNNQVTMQIPPSKPRKSLHKLLNNVTAGGGTPFRSALIYVKTMLERRRLQQQPETSSVYILTDGRSRGNVADLDLATKTMLIDIESGPIRLNRCYAIAQQWQADYVHIDSIPRS